MKNLLHFHAKRAQITIALICALMGFFLVTQLRGQISYSHRLSEQSDQDLGQLIRDLNLETETLRSEVTDGRIRLYKYEGEMASRKTILNEAAQNLENLKILAGLAPVDGEGIQILVSDQKHILNGSDLQAIIEELKAGGAEVIALNGKRIIVRAAIERRRGNVFLNETRVRPPYKIEAIGNSKILYQAVTLPGGIRDSLISLTGVSFRIKRKDTLRIPAIRNKPTYNYATQLTNR